MFFLKQGLNVAGVQAQMEDGISISKKEFMRVGLALITMDTLEFLSSQWNACFRYSFVV